MNRQTIFLCYPKPDTDKPTRFGTSLSLLYGVSIARGSGFDVIYRDYSIQEFDLEDFIHHISKTSIFVTELDAFPLKRSENQNHGLFLLQLAKKHSDIVTTLVFGKYLSANEYIKIPADVVFKTSLESNLQSFLSDYKAGKHKKMYDSAERPLLPFPAREAFDKVLVNSLKYKQLAKSTLIRTSYGCFGKCIFCQRESWNHNRLITHPIDYVISEFELIGKANYRNIWIEDDNFSANLPRAKRLLENLTQLPFEWKLALSSSINIDEEFLSLAKQAKVSIISFGIETIHEPSQLFYRKKQSKEKIQKLISFADNLGLYTVGNFIIGSPFDTEASVLEDIQFAAETKFDQINVKTLDYMKGAPLYNQLPPSLQTKSHVFASLETGLCQLSYEQIQNLKYEYKKTFKAYNENRLKDKIRRYGFPYNYI